MELGLVIGILLDIAASFVLVRIFKDHFSGTRHRSPWELCLSILVACPAFIFALGCWEAETDSYIGTGASVSVMVTGMFLLLALSRKGKDRHYRKVDILLMGLCTPVLSYGGIIQIFGFHESLVLMFLLYLVIEVLRYPDYRRHDCSVTDKKAPAWTYPVAALCMAGFIAGTYLVSFAMMDMGLELIEEDNIYPAIYTGIGLGICQVVLGVMLWAFKEKDSYTRVMCRGIMINLCLALVIVTCFPFTEFM